MALCLSSAAFYCLAAFCCVRAVGMKYSGVGGQWAWWCRVLAPHNQLWARSSLAGLRTGGWVGAVGSGRGTRGLRWPLPGAAAHCSCPGPGSAERDLPPGGKR